jgi:hypothetical protein
MTTKIGMQGDSSSFLDAQSKNIFRSVLAMAQSHGGEYCDPFVIVHSLRSAAELLNMINASKPEIQQLFSDFIILDKASQEEIVSSLRNSVTTIVEHGIDDLKFSSFSKGWKTQALTLSQARTE